MRDVGSKSRQAYEAIRAALLQGSMPFGRWIDVDGVARSLNLSPTPVRFALFMLAGEGLVEAHSRQGFFVPDVSEASLRDLFDIRCQLYLLAESSSHPRAHSAANTAYPVERLPQVLEMLFIEIARSGGREELATLIIKISNRLRMVHRFKVDLLPDLGSEYRRLVDAWQRCDSTELRAAIRASCDLRQTLVPEIVARARLEAQTE